MAPAAAATATTWGWAAAAVASASAVSWTALDLASRNGRAVDSPLAVVAAFLLCASLHAHALAAALWPAKAVAAGAEREARIELCRRIVSHGAKLALAVAAVAVLAVAIDARPDGTLPPVPDRGKQAGAAVDRGRCVVVNTPECSGGVPYFGAVGSSAMLADLNILSLIHI